MIQQPGLVVSAYLGVSLALSSPSAGGLPDPLPGPEKIADGFKFLEGPVWHPTEHYLVFSDQNANTEYRWSPGEEVTVFRSPSNGANGHAFDAQGRLITCEGKARRMTRRERDGSYTVLADGFEGRSLNVPNDVAAHPDGSIYFTDPNYGIKEGGDRQFVYRISPQGILEKALPEAFEKPNGIRLSPDAKTLYLNLTGPNKVLAYTLGEDGLPEGEPRVLAENLDRWPDGLAVHPETGYVFVALFSNQANHPDAQGINIFTPAGEFKGVIPVPGTTTNCCFDHTGKILYVTSGEGLYRIDFGQ